MNSFNYTLRILTDEINFEAAKSAYFSYVQSRLTYGIIFWGATSDWLRVFRAQKSAVRAICKLKARQSCKEYFIENGMLTLPALYIIEACVFIQKHYDEFFRQWVTQHSYRTRNQGHYISNPPFRYNKNNFLLKILKIYNYLPNQLKTYTPQQLKKCLTDKLKPLAIYSVNEF